ncbi:AbrB family transcriptional regulator [Komagataeibacter swingsii]|uniref:Ammonia monooxygenase n=1 Tax=Komagataeibacter swingsii TaxID=215220 RepID=A0A2V4RNA8_9PROT|nr:AbrB family transcriptional regulator [Komagataeibacter swingsii]PYD69072.1 ammonia monooxygenase [Komagataeibacter swingsii]
MLDAGRKRLSLARTSIPSQWVLLLLLSVIFTIPLYYIHLPAAVLIGPMLAAMVLAVHDAHLPIPAMPFLLAQGAVGCMVACSLQLSVFVQVLHEGPLFLGGVLCVIMVCTLIGFYLARRNILPGTTALWGSSPGAATAMTLMSESYGADMRLVAFMQYMRAAFVAMAAAVVARMEGGSHVPSAEPAQDWFPPIAWIPFSETMAIIVIGVWLARLFRLSAGAFMIPLALATVPQDMGLLTIELPPWLLVAGYGVLGWGIGIRFTRATLRYASRVFPYVIQAVGLMILTCGLMALLLARVAHVSLLTAYLATSPGGEDTVAIIAATTPGVDMPFVMAMQTVRFVLVLFTGPFLARVLSRWVV